MGASTVWGRSRLVLSLVTRVVSHMPRLRWVLVTLPKSGLDPYLGGV